MDYNAFKQALKNQDNLTKTVEPVDTKKTDTSKTVPIDNTDLQQKTQDYLKAIVANEAKLPIDRLNVDEPFEKYGIDSVMIVNINRQLEEAFGELPKTLLFEYQTTRALATCFIDNYFEILVKKLAFNVESPTEVAPVIEPVSTPTIQPQRFKPIVSSEVTKSTQTSTQDIAVIGMSGRYPQAKDLNAFWNNLTSGKDSITEIPNERWDLNKYFNPDKYNVGSIYSKWGGFIEDVDKFDPLFFNITPSDAEFIDPQERLFLETAWKVIEDAGYSRDQLSGKKVGVYVGVMYSEYQLLGAEESLKGHIMATSAAFASIANRVSYYLNFNGPSIALDTMCSSSLTAIHLACKSIRDGECQLALAGGVNVSIHPNKYILLSQGKFLASDGHCHSFGEGGDGYVPGEGVGALLLKPLDNALADGDHIYGVIKGSSINHGGKTNGYTVPNPVNQGLLIEENFKKAGIDPQTVSYIEAHGTGTALGDPIEISGLSKAFGQEKRENPIAIGSVKSNIGHLESAAGIAAITKVLLQMQHKVLVPSIYSEKLNANINWDKTPFKVQHQLEQWQRPNDDIPRRAGVSAFGAGGSNAHLIIEEAPDVVASQTATKPAYLFSLSAKTDLALKQLIVDLNQWINQNENSSFEAVSYTLNTGRNHFDKRVAFVATSIDELKEIFQAAQDGNYYQGDVSQKAQDLQILLAAMNELNAAKDAQTYKNSLQGLAHLYVNGYDLDWKSLHLGESQRKISLPTYPFARKRYWVEQTNLLPNPPQIAGLHPLLDSNESTFTEQVFKKILSSEAFYLQDHRIKNQMLFPGSAYLEMARAAGALAGHQEVKSIKDVLWISPLVVEQSPKTIHVNLFPETNQAKWQIYSQQGDEQRIYCEGRISYESEPLSQTHLDLAEIRKRCPNVIEKAAIYQKLKDMDFDYGPTFQVTQNMHSNENEVLAELDLPASMTNTATDFILHPSLIDGALRAILGIHYHSNEPMPLRIPFSMDALLIVKPMTTPCFAYAKTVSDSNQSQMAKADVILCNKDGEIAVIIQGFAAKEFKTTLSHDKELLLYKPEWVVDEHVTALKEPLETCVVFINSSASRTHLEQLAKRMIWVTQGQAYQQVNDTEYELRTDNAEDYKRLISELTNKGLSHFNVLHLWNGKQAHDALTIEPGLKNGLYSCVHLLHALANQTLPIRFIFAYQSDHLTPVYDMVNGFLRAFKLLKPQWQLSTVQFDANTKESNFLSNEFCTKLSSIGQAVRYVNGQRSIRQLQSIDQGLYDATPIQSPLLKSKGVYLLTGGLGGIGLVFANYLASQYQARLVLMGRRPLNDALQLQLTTLKEKGAEVLYIQGDVSVFSDVERTVTTLKNQFGHLDGVLHSAGVVGETPFMETDLEQFKSVLAPKVEGTCYLDRATQAEPLDFFVAFSSVAAEAGDQGVGSYAAGNRFMDSYFALREQLRQSGQRSGKSLSINWPYWSEGGMQLEGGAEESIYTQYTGMQPLAKETGLALFNRLLSLPFAQILIVEGDRNKVEWVLGFAPPAELIVSADLSYSDDALIMPAAENYVKNLLAELTKIPVDEIESQRSFEEYGLDSVKIINFNQLLDKNFANLRKTLLFEYSTVGSLAAYLMKEQRSQLEQILGFEKKPLTHQDKPELIIKSPSPKQTTVTPLQKAIPQTSFKEEAIAIIGLSGRYPQARNLKEFWDNLKAGRDCIEEIPLERWDYGPYYSTEKNIPGKLYAKWGGFITEAGEFDPLFFKISPSEAKQMDPQERLILQTAWETIEDAGYSLESLHAASQSRVGVFMGLMWNEYAFLHNGSTYGNSNTSSLANRVSYFCNFHGPSMVVDTMCSSSLVALHLACESILRGECDYALAGGVNLSLHPTKYVNLSNMGMLSSDGRCKSFGAGGDGYVPGEGVGVALLKPLNQALQDGDLIYGVIRGSNINHGGKTNSYTVPSPDAQAELIAQGLKKANIAPETLNYVEAHGTGTSLGDPIEVTGLDKAFGQAVMRQSCPIGSVKSNVGHLEGAAGIVALTKVLLQLKHKQLVPSLHAQTLNPFIDFTQTPFYVQNELSEWSPKNGMRRRAGISSFGAGGTNAYLIVEEAPDRAESSDANKPAYLISLSAKTEVALKQRMADLIAWINEHEKASIETVSRTLNTGRSHFNKRAALVVTSLKELKEKLLDKQNNQKVSGFFQGDASQKSEDVAINKKALKITLNELQNQDYANAGEYHDNIEVLANLYVKGYDLDWKLLHLGESSRKISLPTYPFAKEHYWITSTAVVAPTVAVAGLHSVLDTNTSTLESLSFSKLFTGKEFYLTDHQVNHIPTLPGVVYIEMALAAWSLIKPAQQHAYLKNLTWISPLQIHDEAQMLTIDLYPEESDVAFKISSTTDDQKTVLHAQGQLEYNLSDVINAPTKLDLNAIQARLTTHQTRDEIYDFFNGLGLNYQSSFQVIDEAWQDEKDVIARLSLPSHLALDDAAFTLHPSLMDGALQTIALFSQDTSNPTLFLPFSIGQINILGTLPVRCLVHSTMDNESETNGMKTFQIQIADENGVVLVQITDFVVRAYGNKPIEKSRVHYYTPNWEKAALTQGSDTLMNPVLVFDEQQHLVLQLREEFPEHRIVWVKAGDAYQLVGENDYQMNTSQADNYLQLLQDLEKLGQFPRQIICHSMNEIPQLAIQSQLQHTYYALFHLTQALIKQKIKNEIQIISINEHASRSENALFTEALAGFFKTMHLEQPKLMGRVIEIYDGAPVNLIQEVMAHESEVRYEENERWIKTYQEITVPPKPSIDALLLKKKGVYLITGGAGGLGLLFARFLAEQYQAKLVLTGRSTLNKKQESILANLEKIGAEVLYVKADVTKRDELERLLAQIKGRFAGLNGVIHSAGVLRDAFILKKTEQDIAEVLAPKIYGSLYLDEITQFESLDFFVLFSSIASVLGSVGQCDYAYANHFIDALANYRNALHQVNQRQGQSISINWPLWEEGGMTIDSNSRDMLDNMLGASTLSTEDGINAFVDTLSLGQTQLIVLPGQTSKLEAVFTKTSNQPSTMQLDKTAPDLDNELLQQETENYLRNMIASVIMLAPEQFDSNEPFESYGIDSIVIIRLTNELERYFNDLPKTLFFEYSTLDQLVNYFVANYSGVLAKKLGVETTSELDTIDHDSIITNYKKTFLDYQKLDVCLVRLASGIDIEVIQAGQGEPVLLLCPWGCVSTAWRHQFEQLSKQYRVISIHYPGCGQSEFDIEWMDFEKLADLMMETISLIGINEPLHLIGWSMGGVIAQYIVEQYPNRVKTLTLVNSTANISAQKKLNRNELNQVMRSFQDDFNLSRDAARDEDKLEMSQINGISSPKIQSLYYSKPIHFNAKEMLKPVNIPTLIISGGRDQIMPAKTSEQFWRSNKNVEFHLLPSEGHYLPLFSYDFFNKTLSKFLKG